MVLNYKQAKEIKGLGTPFLRKLVLNKEIEYLKLGNKIHFKEEVLDAYIEANTIKMEAC